MSIPWGDITPTFAGALSIVGVIWRGFRTLSRRLDHVERIPNLEASLSRVESHVADLDMRLSDLDTRLQQHMVEEQDRLDELDERWAEDRSERAARQQEVDAELSRLRGSITSLIEGTP